MIEMIDGLIGAGKTYTAVYRIAVQLCKGGVVGTNIEIKWDGICKLARDRFGVELEEDQLIRLTDDQIYEFHKHTPSGSPEMPSLVVIDEAALNFDSRDFADTYRKFRETFTFLRQSRKVFTDVIFICQSFNDLDKKMREYAQILWRCKDLSTYGIPGVGLKFPFKIILVLQLTKDGINVVNREYVHKDKAIFACYNTYSLLRSFPRLEGVQTRRVLKKTKVNKVRPVLFAVLAFIDLGLLALNFFVS